MPPFYACVAALVCAAGANFETLTTRYTADPAPLVYNNRMYIYTSHDLANQTGWHMKDWTLQSTADGVNWEDHGVVFSVDECPFGQWAWAQQVVYSEALETFFMYFPAQPAGVGIATSKTPTGPFVNQLSTPILPGDDPTAFIDDDGTAFLCSNNGGGGPTCGQLSADMLSMATSPTVLPIAGLAAHGWFEAPWLSKINGTYMLSFMTGVNVGMWGYSVGYATSSSPISNYTYQGLLMWSNPFNCGAGNASKCENGGGDNNHQGIAEFPADSGQWWFAYHNRKLAVDRGEYIGCQRNVALDRLYIDPAHDGSAGPGTARLLPVTSTPNWLGQLAYVDAYATHPAVLMSAASKGVSSELAIDAEGGFPLNLGYITDGAWIKVSGVDFGAPEGALQFTARVASPLDGGIIQVRLGAVDGPIVANVSVPNTGGWQTWQNVSVNIFHDTVEWYNDVFFTFVNPGMAGGIFNFLSWTFGGGVASGADVPLLDWPITFLSKSTGMWLNENTVESFQPLAANSSYDMDYEQFWVRNVGDGTYAMFCSGTCVWVTNCGDATTLTPTVGATLDEPCTRFMLQGTTEGSYVAKWLVGDGYLRAPPAASFNTFVSFTQADPRNVTEDAARFWLAQAGPPCPYEGCSF